MITPVDFDDLRPDLRDALRSRYERLGYLGDFFRFMGHQPDALIAFDAFTEACKHALPFDLAETISLTAATRLGNDYERHQHERLAVRNGLARDWVADVECLDPTSAALHAGSRPTCSATCSPRSPRSAARRRLGRPLEVIAAPPAADAASPAATCALLQPTSRDLRSGRRRPSGHDRRPWFRPCQNPTVGPDLRRAFRSRPDGTERSGGDRNVRVPPGWPARRVGTLAVAGRDG